MREWESIVPVEEQAIFNKAGFNGKQDIGDNPALLVIDVVTTFTGTKPVDTLKAIEEYSTSCGSAAWDAIPYIKKAIDHARNNNIEVIYTKGDPVNKKFCGSSTKRGKPDDIFKTFSAGIVEEVKPREEEFVLEKTKASGFFGTPLPTYLTRKKIDSLFIVGTSTSGCVRATVVDALSYGYPTFIIEEGCFDRSKFFHNVSLFDMNAKYGTVISYSEFLESVGS